MIVRCGYRLSRTNLINPTSAPILRRPNTNPLSLPRIPRNMRTRSKSFMSHKTQPISLKRFRDSLRKIKIHPSSHRTPQANLRRRLVSHTRLRNLSVYPKNCPVNLVNLVHPRRKQGDPGTRRSRCCHVPATSPLLLPKKASV